MSRQRARDAISESPYPLRMELLVEFSIIIALLFANGLFAMAEIAVVSSRKNRLRAAAEAGDKRARRALDLAQILVRESEVTPC